MRRRRSTALIKILKAFFYKENRPDLWVALAVADNKICQAGGRNVRISDAALFERVQESDLMFNTVYGNRCLIADDRIVNNSAERKTFAVAP